MPKIAFIGAGSFGFTRKLVRDHVDVSTAGIGNHYVDGH